MILIVHHDIKEGTMEKSCRKAYLPKVQTKGGDNILVSS